MIALEEVEERKRKQKKCVAFVVVERKLSLAGLDPDQHQCQSQVRETVYSRYPHLLALSAA